MQDTANPTSHRIGELIRTLSSSQPVEAGSVGPRAVQLVRDGCKRGGLQLSQRYFGATP
jgi:hypothetical protein